jgi:homoserine kinase type II
VLGDIETRLAREVYGRLPEAVIHGDLHPGNVLFRGGAVAGIFDFDWANRWERVRDVGDGLLFFAARRGQPMHPGDIWSLTEAVDIDVSSAGAFLGAYESVTPLSAAEREGLPVVMSARWMQIRIRGMRKVRIEERFRFLHRGDLLETYDRLRGLRIP